MQYPETTWKMRFRWSQTGNARNGRERLEDDVPNSVLATSLSSSFNTVSDSDYFTSSEDAGLQDEPAAINSSCGDAKTFVLITIKCQQDQLERIKKNVVRHAETALRRNKSGNVIGAVLSMKQLKELQATQSQINNRINELRQTFQLLEFGSITPDSVALRINSILMKQVQVAYLGSSQDLINELKSGKVHGLILMKDI